MQILAIICSTTVVDRNIQSASIKHITLYHIKSKRLDFFDSLNDKFSKFNWCLVSLSTCHTTSVEVSLDLFNVCDCSLSVSINELLLLLLLYSEGLQLQLINKIKHSAINKLHNTFPWPRFHGSNLIHLLQTSCTARYQSKKL